MRWSSYKIRGKRKTLTDTNPQSYLIHTYTSFSSSLGHFSRGNKKERLISITEDFLWRLNHFFSTTASPCVHLLLHLAVTPCSQMRCHRRDGRKWHIRTVGCKRDTGLGSAQGQSVDAAVEHRGLDARRVER